MNILLFSQSKLKPIKTPFRIYLSMLIPFKQAKRKIWKCQNVNFIPNKKTIWCFQAALFTCCLISKHFVARRARMFGFVCGRSCLSVAAVTGRHSLVYLPFGCFYSSHVPRFRGGTLCRGSMFSCVCIMYTRIRCPCALCSVIEFCSNLLEYECRSVWYAGISGRAVKLCERW